MNDFELEEYADGIDEAAIEKYLRYEEKIKTPSKIFSKRNFKIAAVAACILILPLIAAMVILPFDAEMEDHKRYFAIKAYAADGDLEELDLDMNLINGTLSSDTSDPSFNWGLSSGTPGPLFNKKPLFQFYITLSDDIKDDLSFWDVDLSVSYNKGENVAFSKDEHIIVAFIFPTQGVDGHQGFCVMGWFEEPTDILIEMTLEETGELLESYSLKVTYLNDSEAYSLALTEVKTNR